MANTFYLGSSPLGLFNVYSRPNRDGMATFNAGKSRNINVFAYNSGERQLTNIKYEGATLRDRVSLFSGGSLPKFWPNIGKIGTDQDYNGFEGGNDYKGLTRTTLHNNDVYDISLLNIIEKLSTSNSAQLKPQDFAYLKYLGVYPHNRLMIARRFGSPAKDNILTKSGTRPKAVLISWKPDTDDFLSFTFGEEWTDADADFTDLLNKIGEDVGIGGMGSGLDASLNLIPLPGFTETIRRVVLEKMGVLEPGQESKPLPSGNPDIIKQAKRRKTVGYGEAASGLKFKVSIRMICEYEQKFISGIDPTMVFMDLLHNILVFGTQNSDNYGLSDGFRKKLETWVSDPSKLVSDIASGITEGFKEIAKQLEEKVGELLDAIDEEPDPEATPAPDPKDEQREALDKAKGEIETIIKSFENSFSKSLEKYKIELMGIANALSGAPSTPWHITLGNPLRPIFCSGDMYTDDLTVTLGPHLAFNDLPINFRVEFTLTNARPLGMQEIMAKFNTGHLRTVNLRKDVNSFLGPINSAPFFDAVDPDTLALASNPPASNGNISQQNTPAVPNTTTGGTQSTTKEGGSSESINRDPNSTTPPTET